MNVILRSADLDRDLAPLVGLLQQQLSPLINRERLNWLYRRCPHGEARVWVAAEEGSGRMVGAAALFPRRIRLDQFVANGFVLGDFCVSEKHRSLGLAVRLQRKCLEEAEHAGFAAGYDLPSNAMLAVYQRLGRRPSHKMVRLVKIVKASKTIATRIKSKPAARLLAKAANAMLRVRRGSTRLKSGVDIGLQRGPIGEEYSDLAQRTGADLGACVDRSSDYLNWRFLDHPRHKYEILWARRRGILEAYLIFLRHGDAVSIIDLFGGKSAEIRKDLIRGLVARLQSSGCESIQANVLASHSYYRDLRSMGFYSREAAPVIFFGAAEQLTNNSAADLNWLLMDGDRES